jgi:hypothetical protein
MSKQAVEKVLVCEDETAQKFIDHVCGKLEGVIKTQALEIALYGRSEYSIEFATLFGFVEDSQ